MLNSNKTEGKKRGRPPGSKNKKGSPKVSTVRRQSKVVGDASIEATIRHLLDLPTSTETKLKLIRAILGM